MKATVLFMSLLLWVYIPTYAQKILTKEEILQNHKTFNKSSQLPKDSTKLCWSDELNIKLRQRIANLKSVGVDSFIVYSISHPGSAYKIDSCASEYSTSCFLIWKKQGIVAIERFKGQCKFNLGNNKSDDIFTFYDTHQSQLKEEIFMPIIYNGELSDSGKITYTTSISFHEPKYSLYYDVNSSYNSFSFGESEITDKRNLFYTYNLSLAAYDLWKRILEQVTK